MELEYIQTFYCFSSSREDIKYNFMNWYYKNIRYSFKKKADAIPVLPKCQVLSK